MLQYLSWLFIVRVTFIPVRKIHQTYTVSTSYFFNCQACIPEMTLCTLFLCTDNINTLLKKEIKSLIGIVFVGLLVLSNKRFQLCEELLDRI